MGTPVQKGPPASAALALLDFRTPPAQRHRRQEQHVSDPAKLWVGPDRQPDTHECPGLQQQKQQQEQHHHVHQQFKPWGCGPGSPVPAQPYMPPESPHLSYFDTNSDAFSIEGVAAIEGEGCVDPDDEWQDAAGVSADSVDFDDPDICPSLESCCDEQILLCLEPPCNFPVCGPHKYELTCVLGQGSYARVYAARDLSTERDVAIKVVVEGHTCRQLVTQGDKARYIASGAIRSKCEEEFKVYQDLDAVEGSAYVQDARAHGIPTAIEAAAEQQSGHLLCSWIALQLLGPSLEGGVCGGRTHNDISREDTALAKAWAESVAQPESLKALARVGRRAFKALSWMHEHGMVHRDIKPANMCTLHGLLPEDGKKIFLVDFGFSQPADPTCFTDSGPGFYGTPLYAARGALRGCLPSPLDDCESMLYALLSMLSPRRSNGRRMRHSLPFDVVLGGEADGIIWSDKELHLWAQRKEQGWREAAERGLIPLALDRCFKYLDNVEPWAPIDYALMLSLLDDMAAEAMPQKRMLQVEAGQGAEVTAEQLQQQDHQNDAFDDGDGDQGKECSVVQGGDDEDVQIAAACRVLALPAAANQARTPRGRGIKRYRAESPGCSPAAGGGPTAGWGVAGNAKRTKACGIAEE